MPCSGGLVLGVGHAGFIIDTAFASEAEESAALGAIGGVAVPLAFAVTAAAATALLATVLLVKIQRRLALNPAPAPT